MSGPARRTILGELRTRGMIRGNVAEQRASQRDFLVLTEQDTLQPQVGAETTCLWRVIGVLYE
jgi:hypothetical protein